MKNVLFICFGNIIRSQIAEAYYNYFTHSENATSAGTDKTSPSRYKRPMDEVIQVMSEEGIDVSQAKVKTITEELAEKADEIYVLTRKEDCPKYIKDSPKVKYWDIEDPFGTTIENFRIIRDKIKLKVKNIL